jgi:hypothetical protein
LGTQIRSYPQERFVGIAIIRDRKRRMIHLAQPYYITHVIEKFQMISCFPRAVLAKPPNIVSRREHNRHLFPISRGCLSCLIYLALVSLPDISFSVGQVARFIECHNASHIKVVRRIISYLCGTQNHGICFMESRKSLRKKSAIGTPTMH